MGREFDDLLGVAADWGPNLGTSTMRYLIVVHSQLLLGHQGHGHGPPGSGESWWHYLTEPEHAFVAWGAIIAVGVIVYITYRALRQTCRTDTRVDAR